MDLQIFEKIYKQLEVKHITLEQSKNMLEKEIQDLNNKISCLEKQSQDLEKVIVILTQAATTSRENARTHFEKIVTDALQFVTQSTDYEFIIKELTNRSKASYEFYIKSNVNGIESIQKPEDANGGGFIDIISTVLKHAYSEVFNDPKIMSGTLLYDEPSKMVSNSMSIKFAEYIKYLGNHYNKQTIMITHNENLANVADKTFMINKSPNGISSATEQLDVRINFKDMEDILDGINIKS